MGNSLLVVRGINHKYIVVGGFMKSKRKRFLSVILCVSMTLSALIPNITVIADESREYPYTVYAAATDDGAINVDADYLCINGSFAACGTIELNNHSSNINGEIIEDVDQDMIYMQNKLNNVYFGEDAETENADYVLANSNLNVALMVYGNMFAEGNLCINASLQATENIELMGNSLNANNICLYSQNGDILISNDNVSFSGLIYAPSGTVRFTSENVNLNGVIIIAQKVVIDASNVNICYSTSLAELIGIESEMIEEEYVVYAYGLYDPEKNSVKIKWFTNSLINNVEILESNDNKVYSTVDFVANSGVYDYPLSKEFDFKFFKVVMHINDKESIESIPFVISRTESGYVCEFMDTDGDGITDIYENYLGTDVTNMDTDGDGLTDYEEIVHTMTNPLEYSYVTEEESKIQVDSDGDGLYDEEEKILGTDVYNVDTDGNGISDEAEIYAQTIFATDASLSKINTDTNPYTLSINITAEGYAPRQIVVGESVYTQAIKSNALFGDVVDVKYDSTHKVQNCTLSFTINVDNIENINGKYAKYSDEYRGIKRFLVFRYYEDIHMLLPIETEYDLEKNVVSCEADGLGTYCLIDVEQWLDNIGFELSDVQIVIEEVSTKTRAMVMTALSEASYTSGTNSKAMKIEAEMEKAFFEGHTYGIYSGSETLSWVEAEAMCEELGGHLVSINTQEEQDFIYKLANVDYATKGLYWLGAYRNEGNMNWYWSDETAFSYINWAPEEPNYEASREYYVHMYQSSGEWNDTLNYLGGSGFYCTSNCGFICEWDYGAAEQVYSVLLGNNWKMVPLTAELLPDQSVDTDLDGLTDWDEVDSESTLISYYNGTPIYPTIQMLQNLGYEIVFPVGKMTAIYGLNDFFANMEIVPCLSNPAERDTDGDGLIDSVDPEPLAVFDKRFYIMDNFDEEPVIDFVERHIARGVKCWGTKSVNVWTLFISVFFADTAVAGGVTSALPTFLVQKDIDDYSAMITPDFSRFLLYYLSIEGETLQLTSNEMYSIIFGQKSNEEHYWYNINQLMDAVEEIVMLDGSSDERIYISTTSGNNFKCACYKGNNCHNHGLGYDDSMAANWGYAVGEALCAMTAEVYVSNNQYCMNVKYYLIDNYEFPVHWNSDDAVDPLDVQAHILHEQGRAKEYKIVGIYDTFVMWSKGENAGGDYADISIDTEQYDADPIS